MDGDDNTPGKTGSFYRIVIVIALVLAVAGVLYFKFAASEAGTGPGGTTGLPRLIDLGADKCVACKAMQPVLEELREEYGEKLDVVFIDVWENPDEVEKYGVKLIPTQVFLDPEGNELFRHEGFLSKEDILATWSNLGYDLSQ